MTKSIFTDNQQKGVSLVITFLIMTIMLAVVLNISIILFNKVNIISNLGSSVSSFNAAYNGVEKTLYFDKKQVPIGAGRGFCNTCNACAPTDCSSCTLVPLATDGCNLTNCINCKLNYNSTFDNRNYIIEAKVTPNPLNSNLSDFYINSQGFYKNTTRTIVKLIKPGNLKIIKNTAGGDGTFNYTISGPTPSTPSITTSGGTGSVTQMVNAGNKAATYTIVETVPIDWTFNSAICNKSYSALANGVTNVTVLTGETTTCTFTNSINTPPVF